MEWLGLATPPEPAIGSSVTEVAVYRISVARKLGDFGAAVDYARRVDPRGIVDLERRARYWEDAALALHGRGKPGPRSNCCSPPNKTCPRKSATGPGRSS